MVRETSGGAYWQSSQRVLCFTVFCLVLLSQARTSHLALAWDETGHKAIARIAWSQMTPAARQRAVELLRRASDNSGIRKLYPQTQPPLSSPAQVFFEEASIWPDLVRSGSRFYPPARVYHRGNWHYRNYFWRFTDDQGNPSDIAVPGGRVEDLPDQWPTDNPRRENALIQLNWYKRSLADRRLSNAGRAVDLAWTLHLVGDIHQPLHSSGRVTSQYPDGDRGGNRFPLAGSPDNLHSYWDQILRIQHHRGPRESDDSYYNRIAAQIMEQHPRQGMAARIRPLQFENWTRESVALAKTRAYPPTLRPGYAPSLAYRAMAYDTSAEQTALAGYRLGAMFNQVLQ